MKITHILTLVLAAALSTGFAAAAPQKSHKSKHSATKRKATNRAKVFACTHCDMASSKPGMCQKCDTKMVATKATVSYECAACKTSADKPGNCPMCKGEMQKTATTYSCENCKTHSAKLGKCTKIGRASCRERV